MRTTREKTSVANPLYSSDEQLEAMAKSFIEHPQSAGAINWSASLLTRWYTSALWQNSANQKPLCAILLRYLAARCDCDFSQLETDDDMPVLLRISWDTDTLYTGLSALRGLRRNTRDALNEERLHLIRLASHGEDYSAAEFIDAKQRLTELEDLVDMLENEVTFFKDLETYVASFEPWTTSTLIAWGGDPDVPMCEQVFTVYAVRTVDGEVIFPSLDAEAWLQDFDTYAHSGPRTLLASDRIVVFKDIDLNVRVRQFIRR